MYAAFKQLPAALAEQTLTPSQYTGAILRVTAGDPTMTPWSQLCDREIRELFRRNGMANIGSTFLQSLVRLL